MPVPVPDLPGLRAAPRESMLRAEPPYLRRALRLMQENLAQGNCHPYYAANNSPAVMCRVCTTANIEYECKSNDDKTNPLHQT